VKGHEQLDTHQYVSKTLGTTLHQQQQQCTSGKTAMERRKQSLINIKTPLRHKPSKLK
jgi:hypothetical protein